MLAQGQGGTGFQPAGILKYVEDLKPGPNTEIGPRLNIKYGFNPDGIKRKINSIGQAGQAKRLF